VIQKLRISSLEYRDVYVSCGGVFGLGKYLYGLSGYFHVTPVMKADVFYYLSGCLVFHSQIC
jgi:hypothetical protein